MSYLITIRPGPVLHVFDGGKQIADVPLTPDASLELAEEPTRGPAIKGECALRTDPVLRHAWRIRG